MSDFLKAETAQLPPAGPQTAPAEDFAPYRSQTQQTLAHTKAIFKKHPLQSLLWAACYLLMVNAFLLFPAIRSWFFYRGFLSGLLPYAQYTLVPLALVCLFAWLSRMVCEDRPAAQGIIDPFRWIKAHSLGRFLWIVFITAAALYCRGMILNEMAGLFVYIIRPDTSQSLTSASSAIPLLDLINSFMPSSYLEVFVQYPLAFVPVFLLLQWIVDFFCIHAAQTQGQGAGGVIHSFGVVKRFFLAEIRLVAKFQLIPYALLCGALMIVGHFFPGNDHLVIIGLAAQGLMVIFSLVYAAQSGIARSLIMMRQPRTAFDPPLEPADFHEIDEQFRRELEEESGGEERLENGEACAADGVQDAKEPAKDGPAP